MTLAAASEVNVSQNAKAALDNFKENTGSQGRIPPPAGQPRRKKRRGPQGSPSAENSPAASPTKNMSNPKQSDAHPKVWGTHFITDHDGIELCFRYAKGKANACPEPCKDGRSHACQHCLHGKVSHPQEEGEGQPEGVFNQMTRGRCWIGNRWIEQRLGHAIELCRGQALQVRGALCWIRWTVLDGPRRCGRPARQRSTQQACAMLGRHPWITTWIQQFGKNVAARRPAQGLELIRTY